MSDTPGKMCIQGLRWKHVSSLDRRIPRMGIVKTFPYSSVSANSSEIRLFCLKYMSYILWYVRNSMLEKEGEEGMRCSKQRFCGIVCPITMAFESDVIV